MKAGQERTDLVEIQYCRFNRWRRHSLGLTQAVLPGRHQLREEVGGSHLAGRALGNLLGASAARGQAPDNAEAAGKPTRTQASSEFCAVAAPGRPLGFERQSRHAFTAIGGVPTKILFGRMKTVFTGDDEEGHVVYSQALPSFNLRYEP